MAQPKRTVLALGFVIGLGALATAAMVSGLSRASGRTFAFRYTASIDHLPSTAQRVRIWIPLAKTRANQQVLARRIRAALPYEIHEEPAFGNDILYLDLAAPMPQPLQIAVDYTAAVHRASVQGQGWADREESVASAHEWAVSLRDEPLMVVNGTVTQLAKQAANGRHTDREKAHAIYDYVRANMRYDNTTPGWGRGDTLRAYQLGAGNCTDFHALFISMSRAIGIPARFAIGATVPQEPGAVASYHCWAEFYQLEHGWVQVDASEAWKHPDKREYYFGSWDPDKFLLSVGRNLQLAPPQSGPPVNYLVHPYVEVDGVPVEGTSAEFEYVGPTTQEGSL